MPMVVSSFLCIMGLIVLATGFWIWMLVDCVMNKKITDNEKIVWVLVILFTHLVGALLYLIFARSPQRPQTPYQPYMQSQSQARPASQPPYNPYQQGYQAAQPMPSAYQQEGVPPPPAASYEQQPPLDYEQPQAMYPHEQNNNE